HSRQAPMPVAARLENGLIHAASVVANHQAKLSRAVLELDADFVRLRVSNGVDHGFAPYFVNLIACERAQRANLAIDDQAELYFVRDLEFMTNLGQGFSEIRAPAFPGPESFYRVACFIDYLPDALKHALQGT